jgi:hypothetical protein
MFELLQSRVLECFIKVKLDMTIQKELLQIEYIGWIAKWPSKTWLESIQTREQ